MSQASSESWVTGTRSAPAGAAALFTRMSSRPNSLSVQSIASPICTADRTSRDTVSARWPASRTSLATASSPPQPPVGLLMPNRTPLEVRTTSAPSTAKRRTMARPMPRSPLQPVTMATFPLSLDMASPFIGVDLNSFLLTQERTAPYAVIPRPRIGQIASTCPRRVAYR